MNRVQLFTVAVAAAGVVAGCAPETQYVHTNASPHALKARPVEEVAVFTTAAPERPYVEVGIVISRVNRSPPQSKSTLIAAVRAEAAKQGCDGIIYAPGSAVLAEATCIVYK
jgi:hypothetical protein